VLNAQCPAALAKVAKGHVIRLSGDEHAFELPIPGQHNQLNAQSAFAAASIMGVSWDEGTASTARISCPAASASACA